MNELFSEHNYSESFASQSIDYPPKKEVPETYLCFTGGSMGPLMGGPQCRLSILRNDNVFCCYILNVPVDFKVA